MDQNTPTEKTTPLRTRIMWALLVFVIVSITAVILSMGIVVGCGQKYPSVAHTATFGNIPQTVWGCMQHTPRGEGERCLEAHPEARKTVGPNGLQKDMGDCLYDYPEIGFQKKDFYLDQAANQK